MTVAMGTIAICLSAAAVETVLGCTSTAGITPSDAITVLLVIGPYCLLGLFAWLHRRKKAVSWVLLSAAVALAAWGLYVYSVDSYRYHTEPTYRLVQRVAAFVVPLIQWAAVLAVGLGLLVLKSRHKDASSGRSRSVETRETLLAK